MEGSNKSEIFNNVDDWDFDERLSKEFESLGFFISDHPLNQYIYDAQNQKHLQ